MVLLLFCRKGQIPLKNWKRPLRKRHQEVGGTTLSFTIYPSSFTIYPSKSFSVYPSKAFLFVYQSTPCLSFTVLPVYLYSSKYFCLSFNVLPVCLSKAFQFILHIPSCLYIKVLPVYPSKYPPLSIKVLLFILQNPSCLSIQVLPLYSLKSFLFIHQNIFSLSIKLILSIHRSISIYPS